MRCGGLRVVGGDDRRLVARQRRELGPRVASACSLSAAITRPPASGCSPARSSRQPHVGVAQHLGHPVAVGVQRGAQPPRRLGGRQHDGEVGVAAAAVGHPLHVAVVGAEGHRAADAVAAAPACTSRSSRRSRRPRRRRRPTGSACCRSGTACPRAAAGARRPARRRPRSPSGPRPRARPCGAARRRSAASAAAPRAGGAPPARPRRSGR